MGPGTVATPWRPASNAADHLAYGQETLNWAIQARGQDLGNLLAVAVLVVAAVRYRKGSQQAGLVWLGALMYLIYAFVVYAVAVHLNYLFLVYVAVLGLSAWVVIFHVNRVGGGDLQYPQGPSSTMAAWVSLGIGVLFAGLWLSELVPALVSGTVPASLTEAGLWVNPIHVIDLSIVLPGCIIAGVAALGRRDHGLFWLAPWLVFSALMWTSIIAAMVLMIMAGTRSAEPAAVMVATLVAASLLAAWRYLKGVDSFRASDSTHGRATGTTCLLVPDLEHRTACSRRQLRQRPRSGHRHPQVHRRLEGPLPPLHLDQDRRRDPAPRYP